jgi:hypothetical protein
MDGFLVAFPLAPGIVETDMGTPFFPFAVSSIHSSPFLGRSQVQKDTTGTLKNAIAQIGLSPEDASAQLIDIIDNSTREGEGGQFVNVDGGRIDW